MPGRPGQFVVVRPPVEFAVLDEAGLDEGIEIGIQVSVVDISPGRVLDPCFDLLSGGTVQRYDHEQEIALKASRLEQCHVSAPARFRLCYQGAKRRRRGLCVGGGPATRLLVGADGRCSAPDLSFQTLDKELRPAIRVLSVGSDTTLSRSDS